MKASADQWQDMKWYRGARRWNNGCTRYGNRYLLRLVMQWAQDRKACWNDNLRKGRKETLFGKTWDEYQTSTS